MVDVHIKDSPIPASPVVPAQLSGDTEISFRCYKGIKCFNACCSNIDITLTPYDIVRLKQRLGLDSSEFLVKYTYPFEMEKDGIAGVKMAPVEGGSACQFMTDEGCSVYEDRPTACRYYPVGLISMRKQDEYTDTTTYAVVEEAHCLGHQEDRTLTIDEYRKEQGVEDYDLHGRGWRQLVLKKKSSGPTIGAPSKRSRQLFFMACYDLDRFRLFINSEGFRQSFDVSDEEYLKINEDELELLEFAYRFLKQIYFGDNTIAVREGAVEARIERLKSVNAEVADQQSTAAGYDAAIEPPDLT